LIQQKLSTETQFWAFGFKLSSATYYVDQYFQKIRKLI